MPPSGQPLAGATLTVGIRVLFGAGNSGLGPVPAATGSVASSPQPASATAVAARKSEAGDSMRMRRILKSKRVFDYQQGCAPSGSLVPHLGDGGEWRGHRVHKLHTILCAS